MIGIIYPKLELNQGQGLSEYLPVYLHQSNRGLIDEDIQEDIQRVPVLGSIPVLGKLFQSSSESKVKKNLMVFLRPKILVDSESVSQISTEKYNFIKAEQLLKQQSNLIDLTKDK